MDGTKHRPGRKRIEFGDFQTSPRLARTICDHLARTLPIPRTVIEPACGLGSFLFAAANVFPGAKSVIGVEIDRHYFNQVIDAAQQRSDYGRFRLCCDDSLRLDWPSFVRGLPEPWLVIGNPPWVTNAALGSFDSPNLPSKSNVDLHRGIDAVTGKANFDISEWLIRQMFTLLDGRHAATAVLCKKSVARKLLGFAWRRNLQMSSSRMHHIDAGVEFGTAVDACLFVCEFRPGCELPSAEIYESVAAPSPLSRIGWRNGTLIADLELLQRWRHLRANPDEQAMKWRSGVKHDCASVLELSERNGKLWNKLGETVDIEPDCVYPLCKSSDVARGETKVPRRWLIVPQRRLGADTATLARAAPRTWSYLLAHGKRLDGRKSSIYRGRPRFSVFGVGDYTFASWKVAVSGFYKRLLFSPIGRHHGKPILLDDTCYFLSCRSRRDAQQIAASLNSDMAREFFASFIFWDAKRPITADLLRLLDIQKLDTELCDGIRHDTLAGHRKKYK